MAGTSAERRAMIVRNLAPIMALAFFLLMCAFYVMDERGLYDAVLVAWGIEPFRFAFLDTDAVLSAVRCANEGIDPYLANPCDPLGRIDTYPPTWLFLRVFPVTEAWISPAGLLVDLAFIGSLFLLPKPGSIGRALVLGIAVVSSAVVFAMERGNSDLLLFAMVATAAALVARSPVCRVAGYCLILTSGLLKYYPMAAMAVAMRERQGRFLAIAAASVVVIAAAATAVRTDLPKAFANIPQGSYFGDQFGSTTLSGGLSQLLALPSPAATVLWVATVAGCLAAAVAIGLKTHTRSLLVRLDDRERDFLLVGSLMVLGCFFAAQNIGYRAVNLLLVLPSLLALAGGAGSRIRALPVCVILLLWNVGWRENLKLFASEHWGGEAGGVVALVLWMLREALWWWVVTYLLAFVAALLIDTPVARGFLPLRRLVQRSGVVEASATGRT